MNKVRRFIPIIIFILYLVVLEIYFWNNTDQCGLGFGMITHGSIFPILVFVISLIYSLTTKSKKKYFLALLFGILIMIFEVTTYELLNGSINLSVILLGLIYSVVSLIGIFLGNLRKNNKKSEFMFTLFSL